METSELLKKVRRIEIKTRGLSRNIFAGQYHSAFKGRGMAFSEVREYQYGDDIRDIDWNVTARYVRPYVKVFEEERELTVMLLIDVSGSRDFGSVNVMKKEVITEIAATLAFSAIQNNDKIGVVFFSDKIEKFIPPQKGKKHILYIIRELIRQLGKERTVILSSHILSEVQQVCTTILILSKGKLVACDTPENLERLFAGKSTVELTVEAAEKEIPGILSGVSHIVSRTVKARQDGACDVTLELDVPAENEVCREIFFAFSKAGKAILRMTAGKASLEDIFMELTDSGKGEETK